jgi:ankyrin repeat protein
MIQVDRKKRKGSFSPAVYTHKINSTSEKHMLPVIIFGGKTRRTQALIRALQNGDREKALKLLKRGVNVQLKGQLGHAPLHWAVKQGYKDIVQQLLEKDANMDDRMPDGRTPIHLAAELGHKDIAQMLLRGGANINARNITGQTAVEMAYRAGHTELAKMLESQGGKRNY